MKIADMNWQDVEAQVARDTRCVWPIGSTEQHAQLSLCVDVILAERVAFEAAEPLNIPVFPVMPFGLAPYFTAFPGTISLSVETLLAVARDFVSSIYRMGFRQLVIVNGHGGNAPVGALAQELMAEHEGLSIKFHNWWSAPATFAKVQTISPSGSHANWMENFPWTRLAHAQAPDGEKPAPDMSRFISAGPTLAREILGDGSFGGAWQMPDKSMLDLWKTGVEETRDCMLGPWPTATGSGNAGSDNKETT